MHIDDMGWCLQRYSHFEVIEEYKIVLYPERNGHLGYRVSTIFIPHAAEEVVTLQQHAPANIQGQRALHACLARCRRMSKITISTFRLQLHDCILRNSRCSTRCTFTKLSHDGQHPHPSNAQSTSPYSPWDEASNKAMQTLHATRSDGDLIYYR